ncbi:MAG: beta-N-acetylhexosaminidase [Acidobacteria bacterium]|nr:MAG: beta-N-acetylhexosaminidase [Acidobacteriota bacterium]
MRFFVLLCVLSATSLFAAQSSTANAAQPGPPWNLMPVPAKLEAGSGQWIVQQGLTISLSGVDDPRVRSAAQRFVDHLSHQTGIPLHYLTAEPDKATIAIRCERAGEKVQKLGEDESYKLDVTETGAKLSAPTTLGVIHGLQTLLQLVAPGTRGFAAPAVHIEDVPRFPWRGLLLDSCRHWMPMEVVKRTLDGMEAVKMNVLHFHLSENQGFRVESRKFPKLHEMGSGGHYYSQEQIKELLAYARDRGIRVMPEFDMPGHATAWFVGYPELASAPGPYEVETKWGVFDPAMDPTKESTYKFLDKFIGEMTELFPDEFFHLGGDEVNGKQWNGSSQIQSFMKSHNLNTNEDLQTYFTQRVVKIIQKYKKTPVGWDEVLTPDLPKDVVVHSWRGPESEAKAVQDGHRALLSNGYYLDLAEPAEKHYLNDPLGGDAAKLSPEQQKMILGGEACMWSEMVSAENVDSRIWPRTAAIAERLWSPLDVRDVDSMYSRMEVVSERLATLGLTQHSALHSMKERLAPQHLYALRTLANTVEPVKGYSRSGTHKYSTDAPLNRLPDAVPPESIEARKFARLVDRIVARTASEADIALVRDTMIDWKLNHDRLSPALQNSLLTEDIAISQNLSAAATIGLQALDMLGSPSSVPTGWADQQMAQLEPMKKGQAELLLMVVPPIQKLVQAVSK